MTPHARKVAGSEQAPVIAPLAVLVSCALLVLAQLYLAITLAPVIREVLGGSQEAAAAAVGTTYALAYGLGFLIFGPLSDRYGRKPVLVPGMAVLAVANVRVPPNWSRRFKNHQEKLKSGDVYECAEVVRTLTRREQSGALSTAEKSMHARARHILVSELSGSWGIDPEAAEARIDSVLAAAAAARPAHRTSAPSHGPRPVGRALSPTRRPPPDPGRGLA